MILAAAIYARVAAAVRNPAQASVDEARLAASMAEAIRQYRVFIAQNALDANDQWVDARPRQLSRDADRAGPGSLEAQRLNQVAYKGGEAPPEFMEIAASLIAANVAAPAAAQGLLLTTRLAPNLRNAIFPQQAARSILAARRANKVVGELAGKGVEEGVKMVVKSSRLGARIFGAAMKAGPQILVDLAIEMIVATAEHFAAVLNARPTLVTQLAGAQQAVNLLRELNADEEWLYQQWSLAQGDEAAMSGNLAVFDRLAKTALAQAPTAPSVGTGVTEPIAPPQFDIVSDSGVCLRAQGTSVALAVCSSGVKWISVDGALKPAGTTACLTAGTVMTLAQCAPVPLPI